MPTLKSGQFVDARKGPRQTTTPTTYVTPTHKPPPKSAVQRQTEYRLRLNAAGRIEVRGIYAHPDDHATLRAVAVSLQKARQGAVKPDPRQRKLAL